jgi:serine/threonine-protein kinase
VDDQDTGHAATVADTGPSRAGASAPTGAARYRDGEVIGRGGMGEVVAARDEQIGRSVAIKRMRQGGSPDGIARFVREAQIQGRLEHPAVVPVHELSTDADGNPYFVMKRLAGRTLAELLAEPAGAQKRMLRALAEVCLAVELAHTRGIVHRDLKPSNIMLGDFGEVYVLDWGIAHVMGEGPRTSFSDIDTLDGDKTLEGTVLGTPGYMAPEQARGDGALDGRADVYALGCILYEILAGRPLHPRGHAGLASALAGVDARPSLVRDVPPELDALCVAATATDRGARTATARALGDAIQRYLDGDRDLELRRDLAQRELERARGALAADRSDDAMRAAGRAMALDPRAQEPAALVARLMVTPPDVTPPEVEREMLRLDERAQQMQAKAGSLAIVVYFAFLPIFYAVGFHDLAELVAIAGLAGGMLALSVVAYRRPRVVFGYAACGLNAVATLIITRMTSPVLVGPEIATLAIVIFASNPRFRVWALYLLGVVGVVVAWLMEFAHPTVDLIDNTLVLHAASDGLARTPMLMALVTVGVLLPGIAAVVIHRLALQRHDMQRALQLQAWRLRQLVPEAG